MRQQDTSWRANIEPWPITCDQGAICPLVQALTMVGLGHPPL